MLTDATPLATEVMGPMEAPYFLTPVTDSLCPPPLRPHLDLTSQDILSSGSKRSARTLVSQASTYDKFDADEDLEHAPLTQPDGVASFTIEEDDGWRPTHDRSTSRVERRKQWIVSASRLPWARTTDKLESSCRSREVLPRASSSS